MASAGVAALLGQRDQNFRLESDSPFGFYVRDTNRNGFAEFPVLLTGDRELSDWVKPVLGRTNTFRTIDVGKPRDVTLIPFYRMQERDIVALNITGLPTNILLDRNGSVAMATAGYSEEMPENIRRLVEEMGDGSAESGDRTGR